MDLRNIDFTDNKTLEKYSSAFTLSDMEIFIFPELFYSLVLANIMSPVIWEWRNNPWFKDIHKRSFTKKVNRIKQFIMNNFVFNLDLDTWGLTTKDKELNRFKDFCDLDILKQSNALFGYEGDKYYFDIDIRRHFGLDKYTDDKIPYWKTETVEAMDAFKYKDNYTVGAGECVSLSALYAAAMFVVGKIPLEKIYLVATPLHSQNFINYKEGIITNNRRILTKTMWFNGTSLTAKARRALENEKVTIVSHITGHIHVLYDKATIDEKAYATFRESLTKYLKSEITPLVVSNFLRNESDCRACFQYAYIRQGKKHYIGLEKIYHYEHTSKYSFSGDTRQHLLKEIDAEEYNLSPLENRLIVNDLEDYLVKNHTVTVADLEKRANDTFFVEKCPRIDNMFQRLLKFIEVKPRFPSAEKNYVNKSQLCIEAGNSREQIIEYLEQMSDINPVASLAIYASRNMDKADWKPFIKAAIERNPICIEALKQKTTNEVYLLLQDIENQSIYNANRLALPDEVWNYQRGDGIEKAILLINLIKSNAPGTEAKIAISGSEVILTVSGKRYSFISGKTIEKEMII